MSNKLPGTNKHLQLSDGSENKIIMNTKFHITSLKEIIALGVLGIAGNIAVFILPVIVGALVDYVNLSIQQASYVASADMFGLGIGTFAWSRFILTSNWRIFAFASAVLLFLGNVSCGLSDTFLAVGLSRFVAGIGAGLMLTIGVSGLAQTANPDRVMGLFGMVITAVAALCLYTIPFLLVESGSKGMFFALAGFACLGSVSCWFIPKFSLVKDKSIGKESPDDNIPSSSHASILNHAVTLCGVFLVFFCMSLYLVYLERVGVSNGFVVSQISVGLGTAQFTGVFGAMTAAIISTRFGNRMFPMMFAIALPLLGAVVIATTSSFSLFLASASALIFCWSMLYPYVIGLLISLDVTAKLVAYALVAMTFSKSLSPILGAFLVTETDFSTAYWFCAGGFAFSAVLFLPAIIISDKNLKQNIQEKMR